MSPVIKEISKYYNNIVEMSDSEIHCQKQTPNSVILVRKFNCGLLSVGYSGICLDTEIEKVGLCRG